MADNTETGGGLTAGVTGRWERLQHFLKDVRGELRKVSWPSRDEVKSTTLVVLICVAIFGAYFYVTDFAGFKFIDYLLRKLAS